MKTFNLTEELSQRREIVINKYNSLTENNFFDGCTLRSFMLEVMQMCKNNRISSVKTLEAKLPLFCGFVASNHSRILGGDKVTADLKAKYQGTAFMAMV